MVTGRGWTWPGAALGLVGLWAVSACEKPAQDADQAAPDPGSVVLARVGDEVVTVDDLGFVPVRKSPSRELEELVMRKLAAAEARKRGLADVPKTREKIAQFRRSALTWEEGLLRNALYNSIRHGLTLSEEELLAHFGAMRHQYKAPQWKLRVRRFASEAEARTAAAELGATGRLDPAQSELLGPAPAGLLPPDLLPALSQLQKPGDRQVLALPDGGWLVELEEYLPEALLSFDAARDKIEQDLRATRAEQLLTEELAKLRAERVTIDEAALAVLEEDRDVRRAAAATKKAESAQAGAAPAE